MHQETFMLQIIIITGYKKWASPYTTGITVAGGNGAGSASNQITRPVCVFVDASQNVYVSDQDNSRIQKWSPPYTTGVTVAGGNGVGSAANQLYDPGWIFVDNDTVYVSDFSNFRVQKWAPPYVSGMTVAGGNGSGSNANQVKPQGLFVDAQKNIYVSDYDFHRIQLWKPPYSSGMTIAGTGVSGNSANQLSGPLSIYLDNSKNLYVADRNNHRVQKYAYQTTSVNETFRIPQSITVYPNPAKESIKIHSLTYQGKVTITLKDMFGRVLFKRNDRLNINQLTELDANAYPSGIYIIEVNKDDSSSEIYKITKQ